jgi:hypothetical protein
MARTRTMRLSYEKVDNSTDVASSYVKGERIKKMLKAASYVGHKDDVFVDIDKVTMYLEDACYQVDLLSRNHTNKAYDLVMNEGISKLNFNKIK